MILALDIAKQTGWALCDGRTGTLDLSDSATDYGRMGAAFSNWLANTITERKITDLIVERPFNRGGNTYHLTGLAFTAQAVAYLHSIRRYECPPRELKKFATGNGNASKDEMIAAAQLLDWRVQDDHQADAALLIEWFHAQQKEAA